MMLRVLLSTLASFAVLIPVASSSSSSLLPSPRPPSSAGGVATVRSVTRSVRGGAAAPSVSPPWPVRDLGPSLAASAAGGTVVAAHFVPDEGDKAGGENEECVVVLFRSARAAEASTGDAVGSNLTASAVYGNIYDDGNDDDGGSEENDDNGRYRGLTFLPNGPVFGGAFGVGGDQSSRALRVLDAPSGLLVAAAGFAPDAEHLLGVAAAKIAVRRSAYASSSTYSHPGGAGGGSSQFGDPHRLVREDLSEMVSDAAASDGGRPFGVQMLAVGRSTLAGRARGQGPRHPALEVYTVDPAGGWRHHSPDGGGFAAVGRKAEAAREILAKKFSSSSSGGWRGALDWAVQAAVESSVDREDLRSRGERRRDETADEGKGEPDEMGFPGCGNDCVAVIVFARGNVDRNGGGVCGSRCAAVHPSVVEEAYSRSVRRILEEEEKKLKERDEESKRRRISSSSR